MAERFLKFKVYLNYGTRVQKVKATEYIIFDENRIEVERKYVYSFFDYTRGDESFIPKYSTRNFDVFKEFIKNELGEEKFNEHWIENPQIIG